MILNKILGNCDSVEPPCILQNNDGNGDTGQENAMHDDNLTQVDDDMTQIENSLINDDGNALTQVYDDLAQVVEDPSELVTHSEQLWA